MEIPCEVVPLQEDKNRLFDQNETLKEDNMHFCCSWWPRNFFIQKHNLQLQISGLHNAKRMIIVVELPSSSSSTLHDLHCILAIWKNMDIHDCAWTHYFAYPNFEKHTIGIASRLLCKIRYFGGLGKNR